MLPSSNRGDRKSLPIPDWNTFQRSDRINNGVPDRVNFQSTNDNEDFREKPGAKKIQTKSNPPNENLVPKLLTKPPQRRCSSELSGDGAQYKCDFVLDRPDSSNYSEHFKTSYSKTIEGKSNESPHGSHPTSPKLDSIIQTQLTAASKADRCSDLTIEKNSFLKSSCMADENDGSSEDERAEHNVFMNRPASESKRRISPRRSKRKSGSDTIISDLDMPSSARSDKISRLRNNRSSISLNEIGTIKPGTEGNNESQYSGKRKVQNYSGQGRRSLKRYKKQRGGARSPKSSFRRLRIDGSRSVSETMDWAYKDVSHGHIRHPEVGYLVHPSYFDHKFGRERLCPYGKRCAHRPDCNTIRVLMASRAYMQNTQNLSYRDVEAVWGVSRSTVQRRTDSLRNMPTPERDELYQQFGWENKYTSSMAAEQAPHY